MQEYQISITNNKEDIYYEPMCHFDFGDSITATDDSMYLPRLDNLITEPSVFEEEVETDIEYDSDIYWEWLADMHPDEYQKCVENWANTTIHNAFEAHITSLPYKNASTSSPIQIDNADWEL